jgi:hypothetical protein
MFTLIVTVLAVLAILGFLIRIADSVIAEPGLSTRKSVASSGRRTVDTRRPRADLRGIS